MKLYRILGTGAALMLLSVASASADCVEQHFQCQDAFENSYLACVKACGTDTACLQSCESTRNASYDRCEAMLRACTQNQASQSQRKAAEQAPSPARAPNPRNDAAGGAPRSMEAPSASPRAAREAAPAAPSSEPAPRSRSMALPAPSVQADTGPLNARIYLLRRNAPEPRAEYYGYLIIGSKVSRERKRAVAEGIACRVDVAPTFEAAQNIANLGLIAVPAIANASEETIKPEKLLQAYDWKRAETWLAAAGISAGETFDLSEAVLFVGSRQARSQFMDQKLLAFPDPTTGDPVIADASALSPRYLQRWTDEIIAGVQSGRIQDRQSLQSVMEVHSWLEMAGAPLAAVMKISEAQASSAPASCY
ncbi:MAG: hypothetical protein MRY63_13740 [Neomegalonema sp.]|nr:hypothetical protein [Neomegalonema sp.]